MLQLIKLTIATLENRIDLSRLIVTAFETNNSINDKTNNFFLLFNYAITLLCKGKLTKACGLGGLTSAHSKLVKALFR
jgi:hypothetical protein